jgi:FtsH-binding integral membrane protein
MPELSLHHIDQISRDISEQEISFSHLLEDLIDHVCCDVEYEMKNGMSFTDAYHRVKQKMGSRRLKQIQEETLYAVDTKYRYMKNTMKISGVAGTVLFGFAAMFKIQHWPMAGAILTLAVLSGILFFIPALALSRLSDQENKAKRPVYILGATGIVLFAAGMLFKMQHWPLATLFIILGIILLGFIAFSMFTWLTWKEESHISSMFIFLVIGFILIVVPGAMITLNLQHSYQVYSYTNNAQQTALYDYLLGNNSALVGKYHDSLTYVKMEQVHSKTTGMLSVISSIEEKMVQESEGQPGKPAVSASLIIQTNTGQEILYGKLSRPFDQGPARVFLMPGCKARKELNSSMAEYGSYLASITSTEDLLKYKKMFDTETYLPDGNPDKGDMSLMSALHSLENMKNGLLTVESCILNKVARHN